MDTKRNRFNKTLDYSIISSSIFNETARAKKIAWIDLKMIRDKLKILKILIICQKK